MSAWLLGSSLALLAVFLTSRTWIQLGSTPPRDGVYGFCFFCIGSFTEADLQGWSPSHEALRFDKLGLVEDSLIFWILFLIGCIVPFAFPCGLRR